MLAAAVGATSALSLGAACSTEDSPRQLERIDGPAEVDEERLGGQPGAVNDGDQGG
jgi:hypothetical protein